MIYLIYLLNMNLLYVAHIDMNALRLFFSTSDCFLVLVIKARKKRSKAKNRMKADEKRYDMIGNEYILEMKNKYFIKK